MRMLHKATEMAREMGFAVRAHLCTLHSCTVDGSRLSALTTDEAEIESRCLNIDDPTYIQNTSAVIYVNILYTT